MFKYCFLAVVLLSSAYAASKLGEYTCFGYTMIDDVKGVYHVDCKDTTVFDPAVLQCVKPAAGHWPCGDVKDCSTLPNKRYVDIHSTDPTKKCKTYYTCQNGYYYGHNYCPGDTVFNEAAQLCDWVTNVKPPCGTKSDGGVVG